MQTPVPMLPKSHLPEDVSCGSQLHTEGTRFKIKAFYAVGSICVSPVHRLFSVLSPCPRSLQRCKKLFVSMMF